MTPRELEMTLEDNEPPPDRGIIDSDDEEEVIVAARNNIIATSTYITCFYVIIFMILASEPGFTMCTLFGQAAHINQNETVNGLWTPQEDWIEDILVKNIFEGRRGVGMYTETDQCYTIYYCTVIDSIKYDEDYSFLVSSDGTNFAMLGSRVSAPPDEDTMTLIIGLIGTKAPTTYQLELLQELLDESKKHKYMIKSYTICGSAQSFVTVEL